MIAAFFGVITHSLRLGNPGCTRLESGDESPHSKDASRQGSTPVCRMTLRRSDAEMDDVTVLFPGLFDQSDQLHDRFLHIAEFQHILKHRQ